MASLSLKQSGSKVLSAGTASMTIVRGTDAGFDTTVTTTSTILLVTSRATGTPVYINWELTDGNTITVARTDTTGNITVFWVLLSFSSGVVVQHKSISLSALQTTNTAAINAASIGGGRWIVSGGVNPGNGNANRSFGRLVFDSSTQISATRLTADNSDSAVYKCQVVEYDNATVQTVSGTLSSSTATTDDKTITAVTTAKTAIWGTMSADGGNPDAIFWDAFLTSTTNLRLQRTTGTSLSFNYTVYVVEFTGSESVQANAVAQADGVGTSNLTITAVDTALAVAMLTGVSPIGMSTGRSGSGVSEYERHSASSDLTSTTNHQVVRAEANNAQDYHSQVIEFSEAAAAASTSDAGVRNGSDFTTFVLKRIVRRYAG